MKRLQGYLIDRETGAGISGKAVSFENLAGAAITTATTYAQTVDSVTDADGKFEAWFELSPGPVNVQVDVSASEIKVRKHDEMAQFGSVWSSDISRLGRLFADGVIADFLNELEVTTPSGHTIRIATGAAIIEGLIFSIENGAMDIAGTANTNPAINPRLDLVTLRQYHEDAAGQDSGRQEVVVTLGTASDVAPATPTGADFTDFPLAVISTAYNASSKTVDEDLRTYPNSPPDPVHIFDQDEGTILTDLFVPTEEWAIGEYRTILAMEPTGLDPDAVYDGHVYFNAGFVAENTNSSAVRVFIDLQHAFLAGGGVTDLHFVPLISNREGDGSGVGYTVYGSNSITWPLIGVTGDDTVFIQFKAAYRYEGGSPDVSRLYANGYIHLVKRQ